MANGSMRRREFLPERSRRKESEAMGRSSALLTWLACAVAQAQPMYFTIVSHNEEPNQRQPDYLDREFYLRNRGLLRRMAMIIHEKGAMLNFQSDWNFLEAVAKFDAGDTVADTRGKNIVRWMV
ncbi:MAG: hypothetical protein HY235_10585 [Acidobacteria bacterium]|nr:hypothetical protein [Acidobacteriota bacterium]